jgi:hypothetical protein
MTTTTMENDMITTAQQLADTNDTLQMGPQIGGNLCLMQVIVRAPEGRLVLDDYEIHAKGQDGLTEVVSTSKVTRSSWKIDQHKMWKEFRENRADIQALLSKYSVSDLTPGQYLVSMLKVGNLIGELRTLVNRRMSLARLMREDQIWEYEVLPGIEAFVGAAQFPRLLPRLKRLRAGMPDCFAVNWNIFPLTPVTGSDLDLSDMSQVEAEAIIQQVNERAQQSMMDRLGVVIDGVFGEVLTLCDQISAGALETGKRKSGALEEIFTILDRVRNFEEWANPEVLRRVDVAARSLQGVSINDVNTKTSVQSAIRQVFAPLGEAVEKLRQQRTRIRRSLDI